MLLLPPSSISTVMTRLWASKAFSTNSFTTEAGLSITSPAAILPTTSAGRTLILVSILRLCLQTRQAVISFSTPFATAEKINYPAFGGNQRGILEQHTT